MEASKFMFKKFQEIDMKREYETKLIISFWINNTDTQNANTLDVYIYDIILHYRFRHRPNVFDPHLLRLTLRRYLFQWDY